MPSKRMTMRAALDCLLLSAAQKVGVRVTPKAKVHAFSCCDTHVSLDTSAGPVGASFAIAPDGVNSLLARRAGWKESRLLVPAIESELYVSDKEMARYLTTARFDFGIQPHGYSWLFPKSDHLSIGALVVRRGRISLRRVLGRYLKVLGIGDVERQDLHGSFIPMSPRRDGFTKNRVILVGDAAGFADPLTGEGISFAVRSGQLAAAALLQGAPDWNRVSSAYEQLIKRQITPELSAARLLSRVLYLSPWLEQGSFGAAEASSPMLLWTFSRATGPTVKRYSTPGIT